MEQPDPETPAATAEPRNAFLEEKAFKSRTVLLFGEVNDKVAADIARRLIALDAHSPEPIDMIVSSPGGHLESGDAIHDMIRFVKPRVRMIGTGWVASAGTHIYLAAPKKDRFCLPNTRFMIHQPLGGVGGKATDIRIEAEEILKARERLNRTIAEATGQPLERVAKDTDRNYWMSPEEALAYGIVGKIIKSASEL